MIRKIANYLNPFSQFGKRNYSFLLPFFTTVFCCIAIESWVYFSGINPNAVGIIAIVLFLALIIYFAFHDGIKGGVTTTIITLLYYFYIVYTRRYTGDQLRSGIETILALGILYFAIAGIIGWLRQTIDKLIEREANEKRRFQTIMQQLPVGVIVTDEKGKVEFANKKADAILGTKVPIGFTVGDKFFVNITESKPSPASQSLLAKALATKKPVVNEEFVVEKSNGKKVYIEANVSPIKNVKGKIIAAAEILTNVTAQREIEKRKDDFINMASHELKTPITSMKLYLNALSNRLTTTQDKKALQTLTRVMYQTDRLQNLVSDLLDVSRLQTGKLSLTKEYLALHDMVRETMEELQPNVEQKISVQAQAAMIRVYADKFRIDQVLTNLITNAAKYSPADKPIVIKVKKQHGRAVVSVQDFGIGIEKDQQHKIFDRLYQVSENKEKTYPGLGMGLYISREIVKRHNGRIWVESTPGKGSLFSFSLPLSEKSS